MLLLADRQDGRYATCSKKNFITHYLLTYLLTYWLNPLQNKVNLSCIIKYPLPTLH